MKYALLSFLLTFSILGNAQAAVSQSAAITWKAPVLRENSTPLPANELGGYTLYYGQTAMSVDAQGYLVTSLLPAGVAVVDYAASALSANVSFSLAPRATPYTVYFQLIAKDIFGLISKPASTTGTFLIKPASNPAAPSSLNFTVTCTGAQCTLTIVQ